MDLKTADGFDKAKIGLLRRAAQQDIVVYDYEQCVAILMEREGWTDEEAFEWMEYNVVSAWAGGNAWVFDERMKNIDSLTGIRHTLIRLHLRLEIVLILVPFHNCDSYFSVAIVIQHAEVRKEFVRRLLLGGRHRGEQLPVEGVAVVPAHPLVQRFITWQARPFLESDTVSYISKTNIFSTEIRVS